MRTEGRYAELAGAVAPADTRLNVLDVARTDTATTTDTDTISTAKTWRVRFTDVTLWQALIVAPDAESAEQMAMDNWNEGGTEGFEPEHKLDVVSEGCTTDDYIAEEVQP